MAWCIMYMIYRVFMIVGKRGLKENFEGEREWKEGKGWGEGGWCFLNWWCVCEAPMGWWRS